MGTRSRPSGGYYVYKRERGTLVRWVVEHRPGQGEPKDYHVFLTRTEAEAYKQRQLQLAAQPPAPEEGAPTLQEAWNAYRRNAALRLRPGALETYGGSMDKWVLPALGGSRITELTARRTKQLIDELLARGASVSVVRNAVCALRSVLAEYVEPMGPLRTNPASVQRGWIPQQLPAPKSLTKEQAASFLKAAEGEAYYELIVFLALTGVRLGEALALRWEDVDLGRKVATIRRSVRLGRLAGPKTRFGVRTVDLAAPLLRLLEALPRRGTLVFGSVERPENYVHARHLHYVFHRVSRRAGLAPVNPHMLRHTWATQMLNQAVPLQYVSRALGHHSVAFTAGVYATAMPESRHADVDRLAISVTLGQQPGPVPAAEGAELVDGHQAPAANENRAEPADADEAVDGTGVHP